MPPPASSFSTMAAALPACAQVLTAAARRPHAPPTAAGGVCACARPRACAVPPPRPGQPPEPGTTWTPEPQRQASDRQSRGRGSNQLWPKNGVVYGPTRIPKWSYKTLLIQQIFTESLLTSDVGVLCNRVENKTKLCPHKAYILLRRAQRKINIRLINALEKNKAGYGIL